MRKQHKHTNLAVVLGLGITGLGVIRNLGRNKVRTIGVDSNPLAVAVFSRYCTKRMIYNGKRFKGDFLESLMRLGRNTNEKAVLIPTEDKYVRFVSEHREQLEKDFIFVMPDSELCESIMNKRLFYNLALKHDMPVPKTYFPQLENGGIASIAGQIKYPCIIKPVYSKEWDFASTLKAIKASGPDELVDRYHDVVKHNKSEALIQEVIMGSDNQQYSLCAYFDRASKPLATFVSRKLRQDPVGFGVGTYVKSAQEPEVERIGIDFLKAIKYKGIAEVEFKKNSCDNNFKLIEINPRSWTQNTLPAKSGVNIIYTSYLDALGKFGGQNPEPCQTEAKWINIFRDLYISFQYIRKKEISLTEWIRSLKGKKEFAVFSYDDPAPFIYFPFYSIIRLLKDAMLRLKGTKLLRLMRWSYFFIKNEGILFFLKLVFRRIIRFERFFVMRRNLSENVNPVINGINVNVKMATEEDVRELQSRIDLYAFENYRNNFSKVKTSFFAYYDKKFAGLSWVHFEEDGYKYYKLKSDEAVIGPIYTRDEFRGRGIAPTLVNDMCDYLKNKGYGRAIGIVSRNNRPSIRMFEKSGFKNAGGFVFMEILGAKIFPKGRYDE